MTRVARRTLADVVATHAHCRPNALAVGEGVLSRTWSAFAARVVRAAHALTGAGVGPGDRVCWLGQNSLHIQELLCACSRIGALFCPVNWRQQPDELAFVLDDLAPALVVWQETEIGDAVRAGRAASTHGATWLRHDDGEYDAFVDAAADAVTKDTEHDDIGADDPLLLIYTAAFGGRPNAAMLSSRALIAQGLLMAPWCDIDAESVFMNSGPLFHIGTFMNNLATFVSGGANVFVRRSDGEEMCRAIARYRCTDGFVVGPMVEAIVEANRGERYDLSSFRGRRGHPEFDRWVQRDTSRWGRHPGGYGQTEVMGMATFNLLGVGGAGLHGRPSPLVDLRVVDTDDRELPAGETGEIVIRGSTVMNGYWNRPELNEARARGGWHHTNDLGRYEADGTFTFVGPLTRMLKSGAENIYPAEVEQCLRAHDAVADCAVIGVPDPVWVQSVKAIVVPRDGASVTEAELIEHCRSRIASYKKPRSIAFVDALPRRGFACDYDELDRRFGGGGYPGGATPSV